MTWASHLLAANPDARGLRPSLRAGRGGYDGFLGDPERVSAWSCRCDPCPAGALGVKQRPSGIARLTRPGQPAAARYDADRVGFLKEGIAGNVQGVWFVPDRQRPKQWSPTGKSARMLRHRLSGAVPPANAMTRPSASTGSASGGGPGSRGRGLDRTGLHPANGQRVWPRGSMADAQTQPRPTSSWSRAD